MANKREGIYQFKVGDVVTSTKGNFFIISFRGTLPDNPKRRGYKVTNMGSKATYYIKIGEAHSRWKFVRHDLTALVLYASLESSEQSGVRYRGF